MELLNFLSREIQVFLIAALPIIELRGAIPIGIAMGMHPIHAALVCLAGSMVPVPFLLFFLKPFFKSLRRFPIIKNFEDWLINRTERKAKNVKKYSIMGLVIFVAVPLPTTGVWTGSIAAALFNLRIKHAFLAIFVGNTIAALIVTLVSHVAVIKF